MDNSTLILQALFSLAFGTGGGALISLWIRKKNAKIDDKIEAERKLKKYSKSLWIDLHEMHFRLNHIKSNLELKNLNEVKPLTYYPDETKNIDWYTKDGYYITSTAYLFSSLSSWISIYQRDITFLDFGDNSTSAEFYRKVERLKQAISDTDKRSIMWYHYFNGIGENIIGNTENTPITFAQFIKQLNSDAKFRLFYSQTFYFLNTLSKGESINLIEQIIREIEECTNYLEQHTDIPRIE